MKVLFSLLLFGVVSISAAAQSATVPKNDGEVPRISLEDAKKAFDESTAVFVDARPPEGYKDEHVKGAVNIPLITVGDKSFDPLPKNKTIIVYCS